MENLHRYKADMLYGDKLESANEVGDFEFFITSRPTITKADRRNANIPISGRNGDLILNDDSYSNVDISFECAIKSKTQDVKQNDIDTFTEWLNKGTYQKLSLYFRPDSYWMACFQGKLAFENKKMDNLYTKFSISFTAKPLQLKLKNNANIIYNTPLPAKIEVDNLYGDSMPILHVTGKGSFEIKVTNARGKQFLIECKDISEANGVLHLDSELMLAYYRTGNATPRSAEEFVLTDEYPMFTHGKNTIEIKPLGGVVKLEIEPRWSVV